MQSESSPQALFCLVDSSITEKISINTVTTLNVAFEGERSLTPLLCAVALHSMFRAAQIFGSVDAFFDDLKSTCGLFSFGFHMIEHWWCPSNYLLCRASG